MHEALVQPALGVPRTAEPELRGSEEAFTLIELMVVLLIIAILLAIAIPTFLGVTSSANDRAAQANGTNAVHEAVAAFENNSQTYNSVTLTKSAPEFNWNNDSAGSGANLVSATGNTVSYWIGDSGASGDGMALILATYAKGTNTCWYLVNLEANPANAGAGIVGDAQSFIQTSGATTGGTFYAHSTGTDCQASLADPPYIWGTSWGTAGNNGSTSGGGSTTTTSDPDTYNCTGATGPCISGISPESGGPGTTFTLTGVNLGTCALPVPLQLPVGGVITSTQVPFQAPSHAPGTHSVSLVCFPTGTNALTFTITGG